MVQLTSAEAAKILKKLNEELSSVMRKEEQSKGVNFSEETDTHVSVSVHVNERAAEQFAKNYAPDVVILQPKRLRDKLRDDLKKAWEAYED